jgi:Xaa-Pro aminopeptidase
VGYDTDMERSTQRGLKSLRLAKELAEGFVITVEPGIYFIPQLIDKMKAEKQFLDFVNYDKLEQYRDFGGIRIEDDILITENGYRVLGELIPKTVAEIEALRNA